MLGNRNLKQVVSAIVGKQHYIALFNMCRNYPDFWKNTLRYLTGRGHYPYEIEIKTPTGIIKPKLYSHEDLLTVNEIFCRYDYYAGSHIRTVVDVGSNIGLSALYFLTRNNLAKCYLYEPDTANTEKLIKNLSGFEDRYRLAEKAVSDETGTIEFGVEATGRYGGIGVNTGKQIRVECININEVLRNVLDKEDVIDILKIDTEGVEIKTVEAINVEYLQRIRRIYLEAQPQYKLHPDYFRQKQYGSICRLKAAARRSLR